MQIENRKMSLNGETKDNPDYCDSDKGINRITLERTSIKEALLNIPIGTTVYAPQHYNLGYIKRIVSDLRKDGVIIISSMATGELTLTRLR